MFYYQILRCQVLFPESSYKKTRFLSSLHNQIFYEQYSLFFKAYPKSLTSFFQTSNPSSPDRWRWVTTYRWVLKLLIHSHFHWPHTVQVHPINRRQTSAGLIIFDDPKLSLVTYIQFFNSLGIRSITFI